MNTLLSQLGLKENNHGVSIGKNHWLSNHQSHKLASINPSHERELAHVSTGDLANYETVIDKAQHAFLKWREVPAPKRGAFIRQIAEALRAKKDVLGTLIALEMGKSKQEGD